MTDLAVSSRNRSITLAARPEGVPQGHGLQIGGNAAAAARPRPTAQPHHLPLARSLYARAHEPERRLCPDGGHRRGNARRHRGPGGRVESRRLSAGRFHPLLERLAGIRAVRRNGRAEAGPRRRAALDRGRRPRHAGPYGLRRSARHRTAEAGRDGRGLGRVRRRRGGRGADRPHQGLPGGRRRGRPGEVRLRDRRARLRRLRQPLRRGVSGGARRRPVPRASTSISRTPAAPCSTPWCRCSTPMPACRSAGASRTTTRRGRRPGPTSYHG